MSGREVEKLQAEVRRLRLANTALLVWAILVTAAFLVNLHLQNDSTIQKPSKIASFAREIFERLGLRSVPSESGQLVAEDSTFDEYCDLIIHYDSKFGAGVYAGRDYVAGEPYQQMTGIITPISNVAGTILDDFIEGFNETHGAVTLGYAMVFNHVASSEDKMVEKFFAAYPSVRFLDGKPSDDVEYRAFRAVKTGDQIFSFYGDDWFGFRPFSEISPKAVGGSYVHIAGDDLYNAPSRVPGCPTITTRLDDETGLLIAQKVFKKGEIIEISRVLLLPEESLKNAGYLEEFVWYRGTNYRKQSAAGAAGTGAAGTGAEGASGAAEVTSAESDITGSIVNTVQQGQGVDSDMDNTVGNGIVSGHFVLLLLGNGGHYRSYAEVTQAVGEGAGVAGAGAGAVVDDYNVEYSWWSGYSSMNEHDEKVRKLQQKDQKRQEKQEAQAAVSFNGLKKQTYGDLQALLKAKQNVPPGATEGCWDRMFVSFVAKRDIAMGEALTVNILRDPVTRHLHIQEPSFDRYCL